MRVLVACEWSNTVRDAFLARGHDAYSCDLEIADHPNPNYRRHIHGDVRPLLRERWDLVVAHPPCTYLCNSGVWLMKRDEGRHNLMIASIMFFKECLEANSPRVAVENPIMHGYAKKELGIEPSGSTLAIWTSLFKGNLSVVARTDTIDTNQHLSKQIQSDHTAAW
jgi:hypothetical protein